MKYYAVRVGKKTGIFNTWDECKEQVIGYEKAEYKSFSDLAEANNYLLGSKNETTSLAPVAYIDGSFNSKNNEYSFGAVLVIEGAEYIFKKKYDADSYSVHRNVAGEIKGAGFIIQYCINHNIKSLDIYYDYIGIEMWYTGAWKARKPISIAYQQFAEDAKKKINITFYKVKSHTNVKYNEMVDKLAKEALGIEA